MGAETAVPSHGEAVDGPTASGMVEAVTGSTVAEAGGAYDARPIGVDRCSGRSWVTGATGGGSEAIASVRLTGDDVNLPFPFLCQFLDTFLRSGSFTRRFGLLARSFARRSLYGSISSLGES